MNSQINLLHLKYFCDAMIYQSISEAAKANYVTQSAISQAIMKLEMSLGMQVIVHTRQKLQITEEGKVVLEQARHIFKAVQDFHDKINQSKETISGTLKFVSTHSLGMSFIASSYKRMQTHFPQVKMCYRLGNLNFIRNALRQGDAQFAIVVYDQGFSQFSKQLLKRGSFYLYQSIEAPHHQIENGILVDDFNGMWIEQLLEHFNQSDSPLKIQTELAGWEVVARFTEMNMGIGFFPDYIMANNRYPTIKIYPMHLPHFEYEICAIYNKNEKLSRATSAFLDQFASN